MKTEENNKLIASFLGWEKDTEDSYILPDNLSDPFYKIDTRYILEFDTDWNWLMEVVDKIESLGYGFNITIGDATVLQNHSAIYSTLIYRIDGTKKLEAVYKTCVEFIKWYNQQKN